VLEVDIGIGVGPHAKSPDVMKRKGAPSRFIKEDLLPSKMSKQYCDWAPSEKRLAWEATLLTRIRRVQFTSPN